MIKITPYYKRPKAEQDEIRELYLNMVADVVPFLPEDVLNNVAAKNSMKSETPRRRTENYQKLLKEFQIPPVCNNLSPRQQDAILARRLVANYSKKLHDYLYQGKSCGDFHVNKENLRELLLVKMPLGGLASDMDFRLSTAVTKKQKGTAQKSGAKKAEDEKKRYLLENVFRYNQFAEHQDIYRFLQMLNVSVCPYCNRQYITTVSCGKKRTRPQMDHFKNKNTYPFLALSINNLVPSCGICNLLKRDDDMDLLYPYEEEMGGLFVFRTKDKKGAFTKLRTGAPLSTEEFDVELMCTDPNSPVCERVQNSIDELALKNLYQSHKDYIAALYFQRYIHTDQFFEDTVRQFPFLASPRHNQHVNRPLRKEEVETARENIKKLLFLMDYGQEKWGDRPLAKLTHDIAKEIEERSIEVKDD